MRNIIFAILIITVFSCNKKKDSSDSDCEESVCTLVLAIETIKVTDSSGYAVMLDEYYTIVNHSDDTLRSATGNTLYDSSYVVLSDDYVSKMYNKTYDFRFVGILNNKVVVDEPFTISADCCHISKVSGKNEVMIQY